MSLMLFIARLFVENVHLLLQGKFIRINFDISGYIAGANIETCILVFGCFV